MESDGQGEDVRGKAPVENPKNGCKFDGRLNWSPTRLVAHASFGGITDSDSTQANAPDAW
jgi:hypothetical protein